MHELFTKMFEIINGSETKRQYGKRYTNITIGKRGMVKDFCDICGKKLNNKYFCRIIFDEEDGKPDFRFCINHIEKVYRLLRKKNIGEYFNGAISVVKENLDTKCSICSNFIRKPSKGICFDGLYSSSYIHGYCAVFLQKDIKKEIEANKENIIKDYL